MPIKDKLCEILDDYGHDLADDHKRLKGLLKDLCHRNIKEVNILVLAVEHGVVSQLRRRATSCPPQILFAQCQTLIETTIGLDPKVAKWAVETWAAAIGVFAPRPILKPTYNLMKREAPKPPPPPPPAPAPTRQPQVSTPLFDPQPGRYPPGIEIKMSCDTPGATIHYTEDGSEPNAASPKYEKPLSQANPISLRARAYCSTMMPSEVAEGVYRIIHSGSGKTRPGGGLSNIFQSETQKEGQVGVAAPTEAKTTIGSLFLKDTSVNSESSEQPTPLPPDNTRQSSLRRPVVGNAFTQDETMNQPGPAAPGLFSFPGADTPEHSKTSENGVREKKTQKKDAPPQKGLGSAFK